MRECFPAGNTYTVLLERACWLWVEHEGDFTGHLYVKTDFTGCRGVGWVTDFSTVNQAYLPYFGELMMPTLPTLLLPAN